MKYIRGSFGFLLAIAAGIALLWFGGSPVYSWFKVQAGVYVPVNALVQSKGVEKLTVPARDESGARTYVSRFCPYINYAYKAGEATHAGRHITSADDCLTKKAEAEKLIEGFTVKSTIPVYYDRGNPAASLPRARLTSDRIFTSVIYWIFALALISLALVFFMYDIWG